MAASCFLMFVACLWRAPQFRSSLCCTLGRNRRCCQALSPASRHAAFSDNSSSEKGPSKLLSSRNRHHGFWGLTARPTDTNSQFRLGPNASSLFSTSSTKLDAEEFDLVIVGAGTSGIAAAKFYLDIHPRSRVAVLEKDDGPGGVWNSSKALSDRQARCMNPLFREIV